MKRCYVGLASTYHDPALAIVGADGRVRFAEATERPLQSKRAFNHPPDLMAEAPRLLREYCSDAEEIVLAHSWSRRFLAALRIGGVGQHALFSPLYAAVERSVLFGLDHLFWPIRSLGAFHRTVLDAMEQAGVNLELHRRARNASALTTPLVHRRYDHHHCHAALATATSPFDQAVCAVVDGFGEWTTTAFFEYRADRGLRRLGSRGLLPKRRASLGAFYGMLCSLCGFDALLGEEWKVMGLAAYGRDDPYLYRLLRPLLRVEGLEVLAGDSPAAYRRRLRSLQTLARAPGEPPELAADLAHTGQRVFAEHMGELLGNLHALGVSDRLVLSGGCALNSAFNGRILESSPFRHLHVPSAPADDGNALGAALLAHAADSPPSGAGRPRGWVAVSRPTGAVGTERPDAEPMTPFLGSRLAPGALDQLRRFSGLRCEQPGDELPARVAGLIADGAIVGWLRGRAEFGPRALGHRSILADPRRAEMKDRINAEVKFREAFRPFAPAILHAHGAEYFEDYQPSWYMDRALRFRPDAARRVPAVVHVDGTGRVQSVRRDWTPTYYRLIEAFYELTGVPLLLNTSFNIMGKPIAHSVEDALGLFQTTGLDALVLDDFLVLDHFDEPIC